MSFSTEKTQVKIQLFSPIPKKRLDMCFSTYSEKRNIRENDYQPRKLCFISYFSPEKTEKKSVSSFEIERSNNPLCSDKKFLEENEEKIKETIDVESFLTDLDLNIK